MPSTGPPLTLLIKHDLDAPVYIFPPSTRPDSCNGHRKVSNVLPEPNRSCPTRTAILLLFPIGRVSFFSGLLGLVPCTSAFPRSGVRSHRTLGVLLSRSLRPPNRPCSPSRPARRTGHNRLRLLMLNSGKELSFEIATLSTLEGTVRDVDKKARKYISTI